MGKMIDRLLANGMYFPYWVPITEKNKSVWRRWNQSLNKDLQEAVVIDADNVARYLYAESDQEYWDINVDFPCIAPPFQSFWIEYSQPAEIRRGSRLDVYPESTKTRFGMLFQCRSIEEIKRHIFADPVGCMREQKEWVRGQFETLWAIHGEGVERKLAEYPGAPEAALATMNRDEMTTLQWALALEEAGRVDIDAVAPDLAWVMTATGYIESASPNRPRNPVIVGPTSFCILPINSDGGIACKAIPGIPTIEGIEGITLKDAMKMRGMETESFFVPLLTLSFMNCKNVRKVVNEPDEPLSKKHEKRNGLPLQRYYTLVIDPMKEVLAKEGGAEKTGLRRALHICRGHFSDYSEGKGLFGKYHGRYWIPNHIRGKRAFGTVEKTYSVRKGERKERGSQ